MRAARSRSRSSRPLISGREQNCRAAFRSFAHRAHQIARVRIRIDAAASLVECDPHLAGEQWIEPAAALQFGKIVGAADVAAVDEYLWER
jgi:hypothetical protein